PTLVLKDGAPVLSISVAGGDLQDQATLGLILDFVDFGMAPEQAVRAPRFATALHQDSFDPNRDRRATMGAPVLSINETVPAAVRQDLARRGHQVETKAAPIAVPVMIYVDAARGQLHAAGDPATGRHAAGL
ncbi:MAG: gamma-glutamyltransferase, partial [Gemmatimonadota bacterium]